MYGFGRKYPTRFQVTRNRRGIIPGGPGGSWDSTSKPKFILFLIIIMVASFGYLGLLPSAPFGTVVHKFGNVSQDNESLVAYVREQVLVHPPSPSDPYDFSNVPKMVNLENPSEYNQSLLVHDIFKQLNQPTNGFFIESGALDGVFLSNTLYLERSYNWTGLLIEVNPDFFEALKTVNRKAWIASSCLSTRPFPEIMDLRINPTTGIHSLIQNNYYHTSKKTIKTQCFPLYTFLLALEKDTIEYLSLDTEGSELAILETIPFDKVKFMVIEVEVDGNQVAGNKDSIQLFLESKGYVLYQYVFPDYIFIHQSLKDRVTLPELSGTRKTLEIGYAALTISLVVSFLKLLESKQ